MGTQLLPPPKGAQLPTFGPCMLWPKGGWMPRCHYDGVSLGMGHIVLDGYPAPPKGGMSPQFSTHVDGGQTAVNLSYCWALVKRGVVAKAAKPVAASRPKPAWLWPYIHAPCLKKRPTFDFLQSWHISLRSDYWYDPIIFGRSVTQKVWNHILLSFPTSPV